MEKDVIGVLSHICPENLQSFTLHADIHSDHDSEIFFQRIHKFRTLIIQLDKLSLVRGSQTAVIALIEQVKLGTLECDHLTIHMTNGMHRQTHSQRLRGMHQAVLNSGIARITYSLSDTMQNEVASRTWLLQRCFPASEAPSGTRIDYEVHTSAKRPKDPGRSRLPADSWGPIRSTVCTLV